MCLLGVDFLLHFYVLFLILDGALAQLARAPALHAGGHRFESDKLHFFDNQITKTRKAGERPGKRPYWGLVVRWHYPSLTPSGL